MIKKKEINVAEVPDRIKQTLESTSIIIYDWMLDSGLHYADLLVYAVLFDMLKREPRTPQHIKLSDIAKRIHYTPQAVYGALELLTDHGYLYRQGEGKKILLSLYPFNTLDLK